MFTDGGAGIAVVEAPDAGDGAAPPRRAKDAAELERFRARQRASLAEDRDGGLVFLARNAWDLNRTLEDWPNIRFSATRERN